MTVLGVLPCKRPLSSYRRSLSLAASVLALSFMTASAPVQAAGDDVEQGRRIYQEGVLPSGAPLTGVRFKNVKVSGKEAACVNCHRRSGMGSAEGDIQVPPITGRFLFAEPEDKALATMDLRRGKRMNLRHEPYTEESLKEAVLHGVDNGGREMSVMMPRYALKEAEMKALSAYLRQLSAQWSPGVTADTIRFATVIAPGVEPKRREVLVEMLKTAFAQKNGSTVVGKGPGGGRRHMVTAAEMILGTERRWELDVWELKGPAETWAAQLEDYYRRQPVFALISGLSNTTWEPVHDFCQNEQVPCWFPSVDLPASAEAFYSVYFSRGVALEADILAGHLRAKKDDRPRRVVQVYRDDFVGRGGAAALSRALAGSGITVEDRVIGDAKAGGLDRALDGIAKEDSVMLWLRPGDLTALETVAPAASATVYFSAELAGGERAPFPASWKERARLVYPYELPDKRNASMENFNAWLRMRNLALIDEPLQAEVFFAVDFLTDTLSDMLDNIYRDYLLERAENMLGIREVRKSTQVARQFAAQRRALNRSEKRESTTIYPHLAIAQGQRFASKGGYIVRFDDSGKVVAESGWIVP